MKLISFYKFLYTVKSRTTNKNNAEVENFVISGDHGTATAGNCGAATSRGGVSVGTNGVGCVRGTNVKIKGGLGAILMIAVEECNTHKIKEWKTIVVDGQSVRENTWYTLENGNVVETENTGNTQS